MFAKSDCEVMGSGDDGIIGGGSRHFELMWEPVDGVYDASGVGGRRPNAETLIMMEAGADVVSTDGVDGKGFTGGGRLMGKNFDAGWSKGRFVKIEMAVYLGMS